jgi:hypothetical protein
VKRFKLVGTISRIKVAAPSFETRARKTRARSSG